MSLPNLNPGTIVFIDEDQHLVGVGEMGNLAKSFVASSPAEFDLALKSHIAAFTRKDGIFVAAHDDKRQSATPATNKAPSAPKHDHPSVVGNIENHKAVGDGGRGEKAGNGDPTHALTTSVDFAGKSYTPTGNKGQSLHDKTPTHEFENEESGHRIWADAKGRAHADGMDEVPGLRKKYEAHVAKLKAGHKDRSSGPK